MHQPHGCVRVLDDNKPTLSQIQHGTDSRKVAPFKLAIFFTSKAHSIVGLSDLLTKNTANMAEFNRKFGTLNGSAPHLYESSTVRKILEDTKR